MTKKSLNKLNELYVGKWRIVQMEQWEKDFIDLVRPGHLEIQKDGSGTMQFGAVEASMDCRVDETKARARLEFTWNGFDEGDPVSGRGWVRMEESSMSGHLYFHEGDDSGFKAEKM